uniref:Uncharacterized protein n=1 Tax=Anguilla anguilla TaxID=7936 RepID=A0A0E9QB82_ANGAN
MVNRNCIHSAFFDQAILN